ncbi:iron chaperone [Caulobacter sp. DWR1-3-2b1]|uniref:iron chaperone n=1 Tax=Caulobacter sp. DWR1-3-2b1 TaxID=2804670 RepID=UPI003CF663A0
MVQSKAANVDDYMSEVSPDRRPALDRLRALCLEAFGGEHELMAFGMPAYGDPKLPWIAFNSQKQHISFYAGQAAVEAFADRLKGVDYGKGCIRWRKPEAMDFELIADILSDIRDQGPGGCR